MQATESMKKYFEDIEYRVKLNYVVAEEARKKGFDPVNKVEIPLAKNLSERVEGLIAVVAPQIIGCGIIGRIKELEEKFGLQDWKVAFTISLEVAQEKFCKFKDKKEAMEMGLRVGMAYLTVGVVASPLEGFTRLGLKKRKDDGKEFFCLYFSGPIRSAGTTATCVFVALADYVRKEMGYAVYDPTETEVKRYIAEIYDYNEKVTTRQYLPSEEELSFMINNLPVMIDGEPTEKYEVSNHKDLDRMETNVLRNGVFLVFCESLTLKASKFWGKFERWYKDFEMNHWKFLKDFVDLQKKIRAKTKKSDKGSEKVLPDYQYISDVVAGRPVLGHPLRAGGFRLRYGRTRMSGFSSDAIHPATMAVLNDYIATGTQLKVERPGKATTFVVCDSIEGPVVKLKNGNVIFLENEEEARKIRPEIEEILFLGDVLINYGDFFNRAHVLIPPGYCEEWWIEELKKEESSPDKLNSKLGYEKGFFENLIANPIKTKISAERAISISKTYGIPLHPRYTFHWETIGNKQLASLIDWLESAVVKREGNEITKIIFPITYDPTRDLEKGDPKRTLELLGIPHNVVTKEYVVLDKDYAQALAASFGFYNKELNKEYLSKIKKYEDPSVLNVINKFSEVRIRDKSGYFIGMRMGRPEKAKMRKLIGSPQALFPVGAEGGKLRCFQAALEKGKITAEFQTFLCENCKKQTISPICEVCNKPTKQVYHCSSCGTDSFLAECAKHHTKNISYKKIALPIQSYFSSTMKNLNLNQYPDLIKGVRGTSNRDHVAEPLAKGILRSINKIYVNKDGTTRYDITELGITHFKPKEIQTPISKLIELGYTEDIYHNALTNEDQILEIKPQDVILPACPDSLDEGADEVLFRVANFIDNMLVSFYKMDKFYNLKDPLDLVGHLLICLSPHTCAGMIGRIIGFSKIQGLVTHPYMHSIMRRDCDGDESGVMLLMDALINFSRQYLPQHRGARQDEPLVLTSTLIASEVDDMIFDMDIVWSYPLEFYKACLEYKMPWDIKIKQIGSTLNTPQQYEGFGFTHNVADINSGTVCSSYKLIPTMEEKVKGQMELAEKIRAVDEIDVARLIIERHFIRDIKGNLRKFSQQQFRCVNCNEIYRRPPLTGKCLKCQGKIIFTISEGSIIKYLEPALSLATKYPISPYLKQSLELTKQRIDSLFGKEKEKQEGLNRWFG